MKYWRLYNSAEKEIGFSPQIVDAIFEGYYTDKNQLWNNIFNKIGGNTIIPKGHLHNKAKQTDLMSVGFGSGDLFLSDKLRNIIELFPIVGVQFADTTIITKKGEIIKSNIIHPYFNDHTVVDFPECEFQVSNAMRSVLHETMKFNTFSEFRLKKEEFIKDSKRFKDASFHKILSISKLAFKETADFGICSVFDVSYGGFGFYVSQILKDLILKEECSGVIFREVNERYP